MSDAAPQLPVPTSSVLMASWTHIATKCAAQNKEYIECKKSDANPAACLACGDKVSGCVLSVLKDLNIKCGPELNAYAKCMDYYGNHFDSCRPEQKKFEAAVESSESQ